MVDCPHCQDKVCKHDGVTWKRECEPAKAEADARHTAARNPAPIAITKITYHGQAKQKREQELREELG
jgi:hypothetical protein